MSAMLRSVIDQVKFLIKIFFSTGDDDLSERSAGDARVIQGEIQVAEMIQEMGAAGLAASVALRCVVGVSAW